MLLNIIKEDVKSAMKSQDKKVLAVLRLITSAIKQAEVDTRQEVSEDKAIEILSKMVKQRQESIVAFQKGNREDLVEIEEYEISIISKYLPTQLDDSEVVEIISQIITDNKFQYKSDMGKLMGILKPLLNGKYDMSKVSLIVKGILI